MKVKHLKGRDRPVGNYAIDRWAGGFDGKHVSDGHEVTLSATYVDGLLGIVGEYDGGVKVWFRYIEVEYTTEEELERQADVLADLVRIRYGIKEKQNEQDR
jgi:hypothetical protein